MNTPEPRKDFKELMIAARKEFAIFGAATRLEDPKVKETLATLIRTLTAIYRNIPHQKEPNVVPAAFISINCAEIIEDADHPLVIRPNDTATLDPDLHAVIQKINAGLRNDEPLFESDGAPFIASHPLTVEQREQLTQELIMRSNRQVHINWLDPELREILGGDKE